MPSFRSIGCLLTPAFLIVLSESALAAPFDKPDKLKQDKICISKLVDNRPTHIVDAEKYFIEILDTFEITHGCLNAAANRLQVVRDERWPVPVVAAMLIKDISESTPACKKLEKNIDHARRVTTRLISNPGKEFFTVRWTDNTAPPRMSIEEFARPGSKIQIECHKVDEDKDKGDKSFKLSELKIGSWQVKLREDQTSLEYGRKDEGYKKAKSAKLSFSNDGLKDESKYDIAATVGLDIGEPVGCGFGVTCRVIPYVKFQQTATMPKASKNDMDKITYGALGQFLWFPRDFFIGAVISLDTQYIVDNSGLKESQLFGETIRVTPTLTFGGQDYPGEQLLLGPVYFNYSYGGIFRHGTTIEAGDSAIFAQQKDFFYYGPELNMWFYGAEGTFLQDFTLTLHYSFLFRGHGLFKELPYFVADLRYKLDKDGDFDITLSYENGREFETFRDRDQLKLSLGYKF
jgi:hypothetical protein